MKASPGSVNANAQYHCHPQTFMAPKNAPISSGGVSEENEKHGYDSRGDPEVVSDSNITSN